MSGPERLEFYQPWVAESSWEQPDLGTQPQEPLMPFQLQHTLLSKNFIPEKHTEGEFVFFTVDLKGEFPVLFPGRLTRGGSATFIVRGRVDSTDATDGPGTAPLHG